MGCDGEKEPPRAEGQPVRVRSVQRYHTGSGVVERPTDFTARPMELFVLEGETFSSIPGAPVSAGEYEFKDVPDGTYYVKHGGNYTLTSARRVDLSSNVLGRQDQTPIAEPSSGVQAWLNVDGLEPWPAADAAGGAGAALWLVSGEVNVHGFLDTSEVLLPGMTSVNDRRVSYTNFSAPWPYRFEQARGDRAWVLQNTQRVAGALPDGSTQRYSTVVRALLLPPFSFDGGEPLPVRGTFQPLPLKEISLDWRLSAFASQATAAHPAASRTFATFNIIPAAHGLEPSGWVGYSGELLWLAMPRDYANDFSARLSYGNPFPSTWGELAWGRVEFAVPYTVPGATGPFGIRATVEVAEPVSALSAGPLQPRVLPPRGLKLDGTDATVARPLSLGSHVISWQPPASGEVSAYRLRLLPYQVENGFPLRHEPVSFRVGGSELSVRLPADVLKPATHYIIELTAISSSRYKVEEEWLLHAVPYGRAQTLSGLLSTP